MKKDTAFVVGPNVSCGAHPATAECIYHGITTRTVEDWLQKKFDVAVAMYNSRVDETLAKKGTPSARKLDNIKITVRSLTDREYNRFSPFILMIPSADIRLSNKAPQKAQNGEIQVMSEEYLAHENGGENLKIHPAIYELIKEFTYKRKGDRMRKEERACADLPIEAYISTSYAKFKLPSHKMSDIMRLAQIREMTVRRGEKVVAVLLNPLLVFHGMMYDNSNPNENYSVNPIGMVFTASGQATFTLRRISEKTVYGSYPTDKDEILNVVRREMGLGRNKRQNNDKKDD